MSPGPPIRRLGFAFNPTQPVALDLRDRALEWCAAQGLSAWDAPAGACQAHAEALAASDALVVLGGDGTFLLAARAIAAIDVPILGINLGKIGFLSKAELHDLEDVLETLAAGDYEIEERMVLEIRILAADGATRQADPAAESGADGHVALNDAAVVRGAHARVMHVEVLVDESRLATYICDGIVVATPTGSTGYSFSAGGPILDPTSRNLVLTPIAAYLSAVRSIVVGPQHVVHIRVVEAVDCLVSIDGHDDIPLAPGDVVEVRAREAPIRFIEPHGALPFWDLVRQKATLLPR